MVENNHLSTHGMEKNFVLTQFSEFLMECFLKHHQIFAILQKMVEEHLQFQLHGV